jgi:hypothetical protein
MEKITSPQYNFLPSIKVLNAWLSTDKNAMISFGISRPGLFNQPSGYYAYGVIIIIILEIVATYLASENMDITAIMGMVVLDFILAAYSYKFQKTIIYGKNQLVFSNTIQTERIRGSVKHAETIRGLIHVLIFLSAILKSYMYFDSINLFNGTTVLVSCLYIAGAYLHTTCTGFCIAFIIFNSLINSEFKQYIESGGQKFSYDKTKPTYSLVIETNIPLIECSTMKHSIVRKGDKYFFDCFGIMPDTDLSNLIASQHNSDAQRTVAVAGVKAQFEMLSSSSSSH